ncbi:ankyrin [Anaeromyces robustus]|uniref:Ankyrin n=1 Tax=Anaeromyces robustus TaxID=1754192 RepID=A0A1Y1WBX3_9FUNG|nr:ankyrin [Anaeromyces robustus]|eukprot:ORX71041.1 ankyrin [Anaeromyces robustus]
MIECLLKKGSEINIIDNNGKSLIANAIQESSLTIVELLIKYGANPEFIDGNKNPPLNYAIQEKSESIVKLLISHGADANFIDLFNISSLAYAIQEKSLPIIKYLIDHGADINFVIESINSNKRQPLIYYAIKSGELPIVQLLLQYNANFDFKNKSNIFEILDILLNNPNTDIFEYLIKNKIDIHDFNGNMIKNLILRNRLDLLKILVEHNLNIELKDRYGYSPLVIAVHNRNLPIVNYLLNIGADIRQLNRHIRIIEVMIFHHELDLLKILIEHNLNVNAQDDDGNTLLIYAIRNRQIDIIEYLLKVGVNINYVKSDNESLDIINRNFNLEFYFEEYKKIKNILNHYKKLMI